MTNLLLNKLTDNCRVFEQNGIVTNGTGTTNFTGCDCKDCEGFAVFVRMGAIAATSVVNLYVQESDDDSTYTNITGASTTVAADDDDLVSLFRSDVLIEQVVVQVRWALFKHQKVVHGHGLKDQASKNEIARFIFVNSVGYQELHVVERDNTFNPLTVALNRELCCVTYLLHV